MMPFTPNVRENEGILLVKVVSGEEMELHWLADTDFHEAFYRSATGAQRRFAIRTNLRPATEETPLVRRPAPEAVRVQNRQPAAVLSAPKAVGPGETFTLDASASSDPEAQPLQYFRWQLPKGAAPKFRVADGRLSDVSKVTLTAPKDFDKLECTLRVYAGLRWSEEAKAVVGRNGPLAPAGAGR